MKKIGLTGGIGSGKSTVAEVFRHLGIPVFNSDLEGRKLQDENEKVRNSIQELFGSEMYVNGKLDRAKLAAVVFSDKVKLEKLNAIVHPAVAEAFEKFCESNRTASYVLKESAILYEIGAEKSLDGMIVVTAPILLRIDRVRKRDGITIHEALDRIDKQMPEEEKIKRADFLIVNDEHQLVIPQIVEVNSRLG